MTSKPLLNVHSIKLCTETEGPFKRCCIWFQGCDIHCPGCCNKELQALEPAHILSVDELLGIVKKAKEQFDVEGVTLSGGEPSLQQALPLFNVKVHELGLGIIMFSGRYKEELDSNLISSVDLLLDGPYEADKTDERNLIGSSNKRITLITDRYKDHLDYFAKGELIEEVSLYGQKLFQNGD